LTWDGKPSLLETAIGRYKSIIGRRLRARSFGQQQTEVAIGCAVLNRILECGSSDPSAELQTHEGTHNLRFNKLKRPS
jgi:hypothetical protein